MLEKTQNPAIRTTFFTLILSFLSFILIVAVVFFWYQSHIRYQNLSLQQSEAKTALKDISQNLAQLKTAQASQENMLNQQEKVLSEIHQFIGQEAQNWQIMRIEYLIQAANDQSFFMHKTQTSIALLQAAEQAINEARLPAWKPLAIAVNKDIDNLSALPAVNFNEILSQLNALDQSLNQLPLIIPKFQIPKENRASVPQTERLNNPVKTNPQEWAWWQAHLNTLWADLKKMFVIHHHTAAITPILDTEQQAYLRENLHLILFQAKWALFNQENVLYHSSLSQLTEWINTYFNAENPVTQTVLANLDILQKTQLISTFPKLEESLSALADIKKNSSSVIVQDNFIFDKPDVENIPHQEPAHNPPPTEAPLTPSKTPETQEVTDS